MTYEESEIFLNDHKNVMGQKFTNNEIEYTIKYLLIAPKDYTDKPALATLIMRTGKGNRLGLINQGLINSNHDVFIIASPPKSDEIYITNLYDYLRESNQL